MHYHFTIKGNEDKGISLAFHEWAFANTIESIENTNVIGNLFAFEKKHEDDEPYFEQKKIGELFVPVPNFKNLGIDEDNYEDFKNHIISCLKCLL